MAPVGGGPVNPGGAAGDGGCGEGAGLVAGVGEGPVAGVVGGGGVVAEDEVFVGFEGDGGGGGGDAGLDGAGGGGVELDGAGEDGGARAERGWVQGGAHDHKSDRRNAGRRGDGVAIDVDMAIADADGFTGEAGDAFDPEVAAGNVEGDEVPAGDGAAFVGDEVVVGADGGLHTP